MKNKSLMKVLSAFLAVAIVLCSAPLSGFVGLDILSLFDIKANAATSGSCGDNVVWSYNDETHVLEITGTGEMKEFFSAGSVLWQSCNYKTVVISEGVTSIGAYAFYNHDALTSVSIPDTVTKISMYAFYDCDGLTSITIPAGVTRIGDYAFEYCEKLTTITIPDTITSIGKTAFDSYNTLENVYYEGNINSYFNIEFSDKYSNPFSAENFYVNGELQNKTELVVPEGITKIDDYAFYCCDWLKSIVLSDTVKSIGDLSFISSALTSITIGEGVTSIGAEAFRLCTGLTSITIPDSVATIGEFAFASSGLVTAIIGSGITSIPENAFYGCSKPVSLTISDSVKSVGYNAFYCSGLDDIYYYGTDEDWKKITVNASNSPFRAATKHFLGEKEHTHSYKSKITEYATCTETGTKTFTCSCGDSYTEIISATGHAVAETTDCCFTCGFLLTEEMLSDTRNVVASGTCGNDITWVIYDDGNLNISGTGDMTDYTRTSSPWFNYRSRIYSVTIGEGITSIGNYMFCRCKGLVSVEIPESVTRIGEGAFYECLELTAVQIPDGVTSIENSTFWTCSKLASVNIPDGVTNIDLLAFYKTALTSVVLPDSVKTIANNAFGWCGSLKKISFTNSVTTIEDYAFQASGLTGVYYYGTSEEWEKIDIGYYNDLYLVAVDGIVHTMGAMGSVHSQTSTITKAPTCTETGTEEHACSCGNSSVQTEILQPTGHSYTATVTEPTCKDSGYTTYICISCGDSYVSDYVDALGHSQGETDEESRIEPTCTEDGYTGDVLCPACGEKLSDGDVIPATGHSWSEWEVVKVPACEEDGVEQRVCENGSPHTETRPVSETGHDWDEGIIDPDSTCNECGTKTYTCKNDKNHQYTEQVPLNPENHDGGESVKNEKASTCTEDGYTGDTYCSGCGEKLSDGEILPAHGHDYRRIDEKCQAPDYGVAGYDYYECSYDSSHNYKEEIPALVKDTFTATFIVTAPFFTEDKTVGTVEFEKGDKYVDEPDVEEYLNYTFAWDEYELNDEDIVIYGRYTQVESDEITEVESENKAEYKDGIAKITLEAKAGTKNIKILSEKTKPVDIILVLDQSGSMAEQLSSDGTTKQKALINCANSFVNEIYKNAVATGAEHRIAVVGFAYSDYNNGKYVNTGILATTDGKTVNYSKLDDSVYAKALIPVVSSTGVNSYITNGINSVAAAGATSAHLGLEIAENIYAANPKEENRERIILFITDGTPTSWGETTSLVQDVAESAIEKANTIKKEQGAKIYSIGVHANADPMADFTSDADGVVTDNKNTFVSFDFNRFLHAISSNYPDAQSMYVSEMGSGSKDSGFYMAVNDTENLNDIFTSILYSAVYVITTFDKVTLVDTISKEFTLTLEQEAEMRENLINTLGIKNEDITVICNEDGTTTVMFENIRAKKIYNSDGSSYYSASVSFYVSADKDTLTGGNFAINTEDAGVEIDGERVETFKIPTVNIPANRNIIVFTIDGVVYRIDEVKLGDEVEIPETDLAEWNVHSGTSVTGNYAVFEAGADDPGHTEGEWQVAQNPTCVSKGREEIKCIFCNEVLAVRETEKTDHIWSSWNEKISPTISKAGVEERSCSVCGEKEEREIPPIQSLLVLDNMKLLRGTVSFKSYKGNDYVAITMTEGKTATGIYTEMIDGSTIEITDIYGTVQALGDRYVAYQSQNKTNPVATMKVTFTDGTIEVYQVVFELYEEEREINFNPTEKIKPIRGKASLATDEKGDYILVEMNEGQSSVGVYKTSLDSTSATLADAEGMFTEQEKLYILYGSQNTSNPEGRLAVSYEDGTVKTYRVLFKLYEEDPYVNVVKGLRPLRGAVIQEADGTIRIKMTSGQKSVGLYKTMANGATFKIVDANGRMTNNPSSVMFYMTNNTANVTATMIFTLPDGTTKEQKIIFDMGLASDPDPLESMTAVRGTVSYQNDGTEDYIEVKANALSSGVGLNKDCLVKYTITDVDGIMTENDTRYYIYKSQNPDGLTANINFLQSDGSYKTYKVKFVF